MVRCGLGVVDGGRCTTLSREGGGKEEGWASVLSSCAVCSVGSWRHGGTVGLLSQPDHRTLTACRCGRGRGRGLDLVMIVIELTYWHHLFW